MLGTTLGVLALLTVFGTGVAWFRRIHAVTIPENRAGFIAAMAVGVLLSLSAFAQSPGWTGGVPAGMAAFLACFFSFTVAISRQKGGSGKLQIGNPIPEFSAPDDNGEPFSISALSGSPFLLKFFRGHW